MTNKNEIYGKVNLIFCIELTKQYEITESTLTIRAKTYILTIVS